MNERQREIDSAKCLCLYDDVVTLVSNANKTNTIGIQRQKRKKKRGK